MKAKTKILAFTLALMMLFTAIPLFAFAEESAQTQTSATVSEGDIVTEYGTIPAADITENSDSVAAVFIDEGKSGTYAYHGCFDSLYVDGSTVDSGAMDYAYTNYIKGKGGVNNAAIYLLKDVTGASSFKDPDSNAGSTIILDLGGNTFTATQNIIYFSTNQSASGQDKFIFKNGTISYTKYVVTMRYIYNTNSNGTGGDFAFENIKFIDNGTSAANSYIVKVTETSVPKATQTTAITFKGCTIETSRDGGALRDEYIPSGDYLSENGKQLAGADTPDDTADDVYAKFTVSCDHNQVKDNGYCAFCGEYTAAPSENDVETPYGTIGSAALVENAVAAVFVENTAASGTYECKGTFTSLYVDGNTTATGAMDYAYQNYLKTAGSPTVVVYLLSDISLSGSCFYQPDTNAGNTVVLDLGGKTITAQKNLMYFQTNYSAEGHDIFIFKNGTIKYSQYVFQVSFRNGLGTGADFTFENITFIDNNTTTTYNYSYIVNAGNNATVPDHNITANVTFINCTVEAADDVTLKDDYIHVPTYSDADGFEVAAGIYEKINIYCDHTAVNAEAVCILCGTDLNPKINNVNVTIDADLALNYYTNIPTEDMNLYTLKIGDSILTPYMKNGAVTFTFDGIGPHQIGNELTAELYRGEDLCDTKTYSVMQYLHELYAIEAAKTNLDNDEETVRDNTVYLICALLTYGQEAEKYTNNGVTSITLPDGMTEDDYMGYAPGEDWYGTDDLLALDKKDDAELYIKSAGVRFDNINKIYFKIYAKEAPTVTLGDKTITLTDADKNGDFYVIYTDGIAPTAYYDEVTLTLSNGESATYSVNTYAYHMSDDEEIGALVNALYNFGICCMDYVGSLPA